MHDRFDDLSRALGSPLPRRRALALIGATVVGAALGLRPRNAYAACNDTGCKCTTDGATGFKVCAKGTDAEGDLIKCTDDKGKACVCSNKNEGEAC